MMRADGFSEVEVDVLVTSPAGLASSAIMKVALVADVTIHYVDDAVIGRHAVDAS